MKSNIKHTVRAHWHLHKRTIAMIITVSAGMLIIVTSLIRLYQPVGTKHLVTFYDRGTKQVILTSADTVMGAIERAKIQLHPADVVEPERSSRLQAAQTDVIIYRSRLVTVADGSVRQSVVTVAQSPNAVLKSAQLTPLGPKDTASFRTGNLSSDGSSIVLTIKRVPDDPKPAPQPQRIVFTPRSNALTASKGAQVFVDSQGVAHRETYYDLPMNRVIGACGGGSYTIRSDGAKIDQQGYILVAANLASYPRCSVVETSMGPGKVYDTGGFAVRHPYGFDLATDWTNYNGL